MSESRNIRIVQDAYAAFERGDIAAVLALLTDDVQWSIPGPPEVPYAGTRHGRDGAAEFFRLLGESDEVQLFEPRTFLADGDVVAVLGRYEARVKTTGMVAATDWVHVFEFRGGKVARWREYYDSAQYAQAYRVPAGAAR